MSEAKVTELTVRFSDLLEASVDSAAQILAKAGFDSAMLPTLNQFTFDTRKEPLNGEDTLQGRWADSGSQRRGWLVVNCDGSMMLEIDLICPWPGKDEVWAESVSVWGAEPQSLRAEVTSMEMLLK